MKLLTLIFYVLRSLILRGPLQTIRLGINEKKGDAQLGISTQEFKYTSTKGMNHYQGASYVVLKKIFNALEKQTRLRSLTDIGSGLGRVLFYAETRHFVELVGIERDPDLVAAAKKNDERRVNSDGSNAIRFVQGDALLFDYAKESRIYFLFNPFGAAVLEGVLKRIQSCIQSPCVFVYMNPVHGQVFEQVGCTELERIKTNFYTEAIFYSLSPKRTK